MPFCSQCGKQVNDADLYCAVCGARQPVTPPPADPFAGITGRTASILCYIPVIGWIPSIIVLAADKFRNNRTVRFHAFQGLYLFVAWLIVDQVVAPIFHAIPSGPIRIDRILHAGILFMWVFMIIKASHEQMYALPVIGELAERSVAER